MKITKVNGGVNVKRKTEDAKRIVETRLMWMPGKRPVIVPIMMPNNNTKTNSNIILYLGIRY